MYKPRAALLALLGCVLVPAFADPGEPDEEMETILVTGEQPGPGLWKVSRDGHVMWVLGSIGQWPASIHWQTREVDTAIAQSQEVLYPGGYGIKADIGIFKAMTLIPAALKAAKNPDGATLEDVLPAATYEKWRALKREYLGDDDGVEKQRPMVAEEKLFNAIGRRQRRTVKYYGVDWVVNQAAKKHKVKVRTLPSVSRETPVPEIRGFLKASRKVDFAEAECFGRNLERIERTLELGEGPEIAWTNAWATGDLETLRKPSALADLGREDCVAAAAKALLGDPAIDLPPEVRAGLQAYARIEELSAQALQEADQKWLDAAEAAIEKNQSTFAVLPINNVMSPTGYLARLREKGYEVQEPQ
jgi:hypothetical protein